MEAFVRAVTRFIGRETEKQEIGELLLKPDVRLLTVTGPGGTGKTRLALEVAAESHDLFRDGVTIVPLASISDPALVLEAIVHALRLRDERKVAALEVLADFLRERDTLLVVDNFEQVAGAAIELAELLARTSKLRVVATSRAALRVAAEHEYPLHPLPLPPPTAQSLADIADVDAIQLFVERARAIRPDFSLTRENAASVSLLCRQLDGLPLPIELAAGRIRQFSPQMMLARMGSRLGFLTDGPRDAPERHRTLRAMIAWSHDLLAAEERSLFRRLAVFSGGAPLASLEAVCAIRGEPDLDIPAALSGLVDHSLVRVEEWDDGERRFRMLETIREFANEELERSEEARTIRERHAEHFLELAREAEPHLRRGRREGSMRRLDAEDDNFRAALDWAMQHRPALALELAGRSYWFWYFRGRLREGRERLERVLARTAGTADPAARARALEGLGFLLPFQADYASAATALEESVALWRGSGDRTGLAYSLAHLARARLDLGDSNACRAAAHESAAIFRDVGDDWGLALALFFFGLSEMFGRPGVPSPEAESAFRAGGRLYRELGCNWGLSGILYCQAEITARRGDDDGARALFEECLTLLREFGDRWRTAHVLATLGRLAWERGDGATARARYEESLALARESGDKQRMLLCLEGFAMLAFDDGDVERAATLMSVVEAARSRRRIPRYESDRPAWEQHLIAVRSRLTDEGFATAWAKGEEETLERAIEAASRGDSAGARHVASLTDREREVLVYLVKGFTFREIGDLLGISPHTVTTHVKHVYGKLGVRGRAEAVYEAIQLGVVKESA